MDRTNLGGEPSIFRGATKLTTPVMVANSEVRGTGVVTRRLSAAHSRRQPAERSSVWERRRTEEESSRPV